MSIIRHLLYNGSSIDALNSGILYSQTLLHNFILQHQPRYILHCGCSDNALSLAYFAKEHYPCEILHIKNWLPSAQDWREAMGETPNPHKLFLDKITDNKLDDYLVSFNGSGETALEVLQSRNFHFNMMVSDALNNDVNYTVLLPLLSKKSLHIRYVGDKKISQIKQDPLFSTDIETSFAYAQGYLITGMDYLSLYEEQQTISMSKNSEHIENSSESHFLKTDFVNQMDTDTDTSEPVWTENGFVYEQKDTTKLPSSQLSPKEERELRRQERRQAREERHKDRISNTEENGDDNKLTKNLEQEINRNVNTHVTDNLSPDRFQIDNNGDSTISAARRALRARRAARRMNAMNIVSDL